MKTLLTMLALVLTLAAWADVTPTASAVTPTAEPKWFNGNWLEKTMTKDDWSSLDAQKQAYKTAKESNDVDGMVANAFWSSSQAWANNNAAYHLIKKITNVDTNDAKQLASQAETLLEKAVELLPDPIEDKSRPEYVRENTERIKADEIIEKNLLFVQRVLGEKPWPKDGESDGE